MQWVLLHFPVLWEINEETHAFPIWEKYEYQFPSFSRYNRFCCISCATGDYWGNTCISHMLKHTIGQEMDEKKVTTPSEKYEYQLSRFSSYNGFCCIFLCHAKLKGKPMHFPYDEIC